MAAQECGICLESVSLQLVLQTTCCRQILCRHCTLSDRAYKPVPTCPFCRQLDYDTCELGSAEEQQESTLPSDTPPSLEGIWEVHITESSAIGSSQHTITLKIQGESGTYEVDEDDDHYENGCWSELQMGNTKSGKSFVGKQKMACAPSWLGQGASIFGHEGLRGRLSGPDSAKFTTSMTVLSPGGSEELEIVQEGEMTRSSRR